MGTSGAENTQLRSGNATLNDSTTARQHDKHKAVKS